MAHTIVFHLIQASKKLQNQLRLKTGGVNLSVSEASTLLVIDSQKDTCQIDIALKLHLKPASIVSLIDELEKLKLVTRQTTKGDRRRYRIMLTEKGKAQVKKIKAQTNSMEKYIRGVLTPNESKVFYSALDKLSHNLDRLQDDLSAKKIDSRKEVKNELPSAKRFMAT